MRLPPRVRAPGITRAYNDHEIALAALVVRDVSGTEIASYFRTHIFEPLDMQSSSLILPREAMQRTAIGYSARGPYPFDYYNLHPAAGAGFNTTALDIANYMIMHLAEGRFRGREILSSEWMKTMHRTGFTHHPRLPGIAYSFDEHFRDAHRYLAKSGGAPGFMNRMLLFPAAGMGIYFVYNRDSTVPLAGRLESALLDMFYPRRESPPLEPELRLAALELQRYAGRYVDLNDYSKTRIERLRSLMNQALVTVALPAFALGAVSGGFDRGAGADCRSVSQYVSDNWWDLRSVMAADFGARKPRQNDLRCVSPTVTQEMRVVRVPA
ncbi:MAG: serine hydrolase, partial [Gammaproteobacteria bacterium]